MKFTNSAAIVALATLLLLFVQSTSGEQGAHSLARITRDASFDRTIEDEHLLQAEKAIDMQHQRRLQINNLWTQIGSDIDGEKLGDHSGHSVSLSSDGKTVAIGSPSFDGYDKEECGHTRIFVWNDSVSTPSWVQIGQVIEGEAALDKSGWSVSLSGDGKTVAIGATGNIGSSVQRPRGHARIFRLEDSTSPTWVKVGPDIDGVEDYDEHGFSVSLSSDGQTVAIGATGHNRSTSNKSGYVRIYDWATPSWVQRGLLIEGEAVYDKHGFSVSLSSNGQTVAIGATGHDSSTGNSDNFGHVRIYEWDDTITTPSWVQLGQDIDGEAAEDESGWSVSLAGDGKTVAIGAPKNNGNNGNNSNAGHTRIYEWNDSPAGWVKLGDDIDGKDHNDEHGYSVSLSSDGKTVAIGATGNDDNGNGAGHARIFKWDDSTWVKLGEDIVGEAAADGYGWSVSLSSDGQSVAIGATMNSGNGLENSGHVQVMKFDSTLSSNSGGDPHITTWHDEHYEYHGQCDLVMMNDPNFVDGLGLDVHIRTKIVRYWSYIKNVAIKIGNDILEIEGSADANDVEPHYWYNFEYQGIMEDLNGFPVTQKLPSYYKRQYKIDLSSKFGPGKHITVQVYKEFLRVTFNGDEAAFGKSVGLLGDFETGKTLGRDGVTVINDFNELGNEWQVLPAEPKLFHEISRPQFPELCIQPEDPRGDRKRRLAESSISVEQAEAACATLKDPLSIKDCIYDILATQDIGMVGAF